MATTPKGDDSDVRHTVMAALARAVARQRMAATVGTKGSRPRKLSATYALGKAPKAMKP